MLAQPVTNKFSREIDCLARLQELTGQLEDILTFLKIEGLVDDNQIRSVRLSAERPKEIRGILKDLKVTQKLQLLQYEWNVLPVENITITLITDRNQKDFVYHGG